MQNLLTFFFSKNISIYAIFNDQSFNDTSLVLNNWALDFINVKTPVNRNFKLNSPSDLIHF